ncbi:copper resistance protein NlpE N-terminal domain-containing protein [Niastella populi]|uniref:NlpE C-terminal OB domain-containing protein n=1 Tax=Niastella populi TaxID=550983 RepID=A0A1V9FTF7_9BACT|nr:copper resistance protein NlpE N-terminal domain-containing protein [Niastella populi]OQP61635.1 hypothetical protein A4R26_18925 [Niastella populi]
MKCCFGLLMLVAVACNSRTPIHVPQTTDTTSTTDSVFNAGQFIPDESGSPTSFVPGYYTGTIPCNDCRSITRKILFLTDHQFHLKDEFNGIQSPPLETEGRWQTTNDQLQLLVNEEVFKRFAVTNKGLSELSMTGAPVPLYPNDYLSHIQIGADNIAWMEKKKAGIDFFALGNEPFWLMEIDVDKQIRFLRVDSSEPTVFPYAPAIIQNRRYIYTTGKNSDSMQVIITPQFCSDGMSDNWYEYKVEAKYNGTMYMGCGVKLNGEW